MASGLQEKGNLASINNFKCFHFPRDSGCFSRPTPSNHHLHGPEGALPHLLTQVPTSSANLLFAVLGMPLPPGILAIEPGSLVFWEVHTSHIQMEFPRHLEHPQQLAFGSAGWAAAFGAALAAAGLFRALGPRVFLGRDTCFLAALGLFMTLVSCFKAFCLLFLA